MNPVTSTASLKWGLLLGCLIGLVQFFVFRNMTSPVESLLSEWLVFGMTLVGAILFAGYSVLMQRMNSLVAKLFLIPVCLVSYIVSIGLVVVAATSIFMRIRSTTPEDDRPYLDTSGIYMDRVNGDLWFYALVTSFPSLVMWILFALGGILVSGNSSSLQKTR